MSHRHSMAFARSWLVRSSRWIWLAGLASSACALGVDDSEAGGADGSAVTGQAASGMAGTGGHPGGGPSVAGAGGQAPAVTPSSAGSPMGGSSGGGASAGNVGGTPPASAGQAGMSSSGAGGAATDGSCGASPADPMANSKVKKLLCYLKSHTNISGQTDLGDGDKVKSMTGRYPAIIAFDFYSYTSGDTSSTQAAIDFWKNKKGIVAFQWHWKAPPGGSFDTNWDYPSALSDPNNKLHQDVHLIVSELKKMGDAGVPVLFRPLHECNNNYMWWAKHGADNYKKLWKVIFDEAAKVGAHNIIWVFNGMASNQSTPMSDWYPGDNQVDVIGSDYFQSQADFDSMQKIGPSKVISIPETFNPLVPGKDPAFSYFVVWASRDWGSKGVENFWKTSMGNPKTISIDQLPDMTQW